MRIEITPKIHDSIHANLYTNIKTLSPSLQVGIVAHKIPTGYTEYEGPFEIFPKYEEDQTIETTTKYLNNNIVVHQVFHAETSNPQGGLTLTIGGYDNG